MQTTIKEKISKSMMGNKNARGPKTQRHKNRISLSKRMQNRFGKNWRDLRVGKLVMEMTGMTQ